MLTVTDSAMHLCRETLRQMPLRSAERLLRIDEEGGRVAISFDLPREDDEIVDDDGRQVLAVPHELADTLSGLTLRVGDHGQLVLS